MGRAILEIQAAYNKKKGAASSEESEPLASEIAGTLHPRGRFLSLARAAVKRDPRRGRIPTAPAEMSFPDPRRGVFATKNQKAGAGKRLRNTCPLSATLTFRGTSLRNRPWRGRSVPACAQVLGLGVEI